MQCSFSPWSWWFRCLWQRSSSGWFVTQQNFRHLSCPVTKTKTSPFADTEHVWRIRSTSTRDSAASIARLVSRITLSRIYSSHYSSSCNQTSMYACICTSAATTCNISTWNSPWWIHCKVYCILKHWSTSSDITRTAYKLEPTVRMTLCVKSNVEPIAGTTS